MAIRKTDLKADCGVKLTLVEDVTPLGTVKGQYYRLTTLRPNQPRVIAEKDRAEEAFDLEVIASLSDPIIQKMITRH
jgi:hypothetical protein